MRALTSLVALCAVAAGASLALACASIIGVAGDVGYRDAAPGEGHANEGASPPDAPPEGATDAPCAKCVTVPVGWTGPVVLFEGMGSPPPAPLSCGPPYGQRAYHGFADLIAPPCTCACAVATQPTCNVATAPVLSAGTCPPASRTSCADAQAPEGDCIDTSSNCPGSFYVQAAPSPSGGACSGPTTDLPDAAWSTVGAACGVRAPLAGCENGQACAPASPRGFLAATCVLRSGDAPCPSTYLTKHVFYQTIDDTRGCACSPCGTPNGSCAGTVHTFSDNSCGTDAGVYSLRVDAGCSGAGTNVQSVTINYDIAGASCSGSSATPSGSVTPRMPTTICCMQ